MFGFATILSASVSLLLASQSVLASPRPSRSLQLSVRSDDDPVIVPACETQCNNLEDAIFNATTPAEACTPSIMTMFQTCLDCEAKNNAAPVAQLQAFVNSFVSDCADAKHPVTNITVAAKGGNSGERVAVGMLGSLVVGLVTVSLTVL
ncbi:hypothetical protein C8R46DRAFT_1041876 [Mycena filopes]|nr:hypothetical protein C8R46DRAFT_1041876 [Mycena filopes]